MFVQKVIHILYGGEMCCVRGERARSQLLNVIQNTSLPLCGVLIDLCINPLIHDMCGISLCHNGRSFAVVVMQVNYSIEQVLKCYMECCPFILSLS